MTDYSEAGRRMSVPIALHTTQSKLERLTSAYFAESPGPDKTRIENELLETLVKLKEIRGRVYS
jgi:hypothetical protein